MFTITDSVENKGAAAATLYPYALVVRDGVPASQHYWVLHEGFVGVADGTLKDASYDDFKDEGTPPKTFTSTGGWVGITDKYWMAAVAPPQQENFDGSYLATPYGSTKAYEANYRLGAHTAAAGGGVVQVVHHLFAGAKVVDTLRFYDHTLGISNFDMAIDWGWFKPITQPLFWVLDQFYKLLGNFGLAILLLTVAVKLVTFPIANASAKTMAKMKKVQPEQEKIKERFADDPAKQQQAMMELYKREKVNPVTGCVPQLLVIPVFFSLYKVFFVTIEMRQAPFYGWIHDLAAPDPTSIVNLFGLSALRCAGIRSGVPVDRHLADPDGHDAMGADQAESGASRSDPGAHVRPDADHVHLHVRNVPGGPCHLLHLEQPARHRATMVHHAPPGRGGSPVQEPAS